VGPSPALAFNGWSAPAPVDPVFSARSVSCPSATFCAAVDYSGNAVIFNGSSWSAPTSIDTRPAAALESPSCASSSVAVAVGARQHRRQPWAQLGLVSFVVLLHGRRLQRERAGLQRQRVDRSGPRRRHAQSRLGLVPVLVLLRGAGLHRSRDHIRRQLLGGA